MNIETAQIRQAVAILRSGGLVAFATETVYGVGADARQDEAVARIFAAKGRPAHNPLIVHVSDQTAALRCALTWPVVAEKLAARFWPGPLTLVVPKAENISHLATAGGPTVGLRVPNHPLALDLLAAFDGPIAAPSANRSNQVSPTTAAHVRDELGDRIDLILDGGPCQVGIESTVIDLSGDAPRILRPGGVSRLQIEAVIGPVAIEIARCAEASILQSPGQSARHYSPSAKVVLFEHGDVNGIRLSAERDTGKCVGAIVISELPGILPDQFTAAMPSEPEEYARLLYSTLRRLDGMGVDAILVERPPRGEAWRAVHDRLSRSAG